LLPNTIYQSVTYSREYKYYTDLWANVSYCSTIMFICLERVFGSVWAKTFRIYWYPMALGL